MERGEKHVFNLPLLLEKEEELRAMQDSNEYWIRVWDLAEFCVKSGLAPYIVEEPFYSDFLCTIFKKGRDNIQYLIPRGHMKTWLWQAIGTFLLCEPHEELGGRLIRFCFTKETSKLAQDSVGAIKGNLERNPYIIKKYGQAKPTAKALKALRGDFPGAEFEKPPWTKACFKTIWAMRAEAEQGIIHKEMNMFAQGMDQGSTGVHMNLTVQDDASNETNATSQVKKARVRSTYHELVSQLQPGGYFIDNGTVHANDDIHKTIQEEYEDQFEFIVRNCFGDGPILTREDYRIEVGEHGIPQYIPIPEDADCLWDGYGQIEEDLRRGHPLPPEERKMRALHFLGKKMFGMPPSRFAHQFLNQAVHHDDQIFYDWMFKTYNSVDFAGMNTYVLTDSASGQDMRSSYRVVAVVSMDWNGVAYVRDIDFGFWVPTEYASRIVSAYDRYQAKKVLMEKVSWQEAFKAVISEMRKAEGKPNVRVADIRGRSLATKLERIEALEPRLSAGKMWFNPDIKQKVCAEKDAWKEMVRQFCAVHELQNTEGIRVDVADALGDIEALDKDGNRICRSPQLQRIAKIRANERPDPMKGYREATNTLRPSDAPRKRDKRSLFGGKKPSRNLFG